MLTVRCFIKPQEKLPLHIFSLVLTNSEQLFLARNQEGSCGVHIPKSPKGCVAVEAMESWISVLSRNIRLYCQYGEGSGRKKQDTGEAKAHEKIAKETKKDRKKRTGNTNVMRKHIVKFDKIKVKHKALNSKARDEEKYSTAELKIWCSVWKLRGDNVIPSKAEEVKAYATMLKDREQLIVKQLLLDL